MPLFTVCRKCGRPFTWYDGEMLCRSCRLKLMPQEHFKRYEKREARIRKDLNLN